MASDAVSVPPPIKYEVFVNFRGTDTRKSFTSHLKEALDRNGINAFTDTGLEAGEEISTTLDSRITESLVSVVVFSPNYADSRWCLDELVRIMECKEANNQTVLPVFLQGVEPTHVRKQIGAFGEGFGRLIQDARYAHRKASWERALKEAADLAGHATDQMSEGEIVKKLINRVQSVLSKTFSIDLDKRFIVMKHVEIVESSMFASEQQWRCLGIWGMGGSGKTTLAKEIQKRVSNQFGGSCFIEKVEELAKRGKLNRLYWKQMAQLLKINDASQDLPNIQRKLGITKVLIILDDVSDASQFQELIGYWDSYCPGSKIIVISRDQQILKNIECDAIYEVQALNGHESLQLLKHHILKKREPTADQMELLKDAIKYTKGLPLALEVLGRNLFDKDITIWKSELVKLGDKPNLHIMKILKTSFDGLDDDEKNIFLDIACFMNGWAKYRVESMIDACGFHAISGIDRLVDRALITISDQRIKMHDLLQQIGQDIASREGSRLCKTKEIADLLTRNQVGKRKRKLEVISMDLSKATSIELSPRVFKKMKRLRILHFENDYFRRTEISLPKGLKYLPARLRYLEWDLYPEQSLPPRFNPENLVELRMRESSLRRLWTGGIEPCLPSLKHVDLSHSRNLATLPNFRNSLKLETLELYDCQNLTDVPDLSRLTKLVELNLSGCSEFRILRQLPPSLIELNLTSTKIKKLENTSIQGLSQLNWLLLYGCEELESLPDNICVLKNIEQLDLSECPKLLTLPSLQMHIIQGSTLEDPPAVIDGLRSLEFFWYKGETLPSLKSLVSLKQLDLQGSNLKSLPEDIKYLTNLWKINVSKSRSLSCIPELPPSLLYLDASDCTSLQKYIHFSSFEFDAGLLSKIYIEKYGKKLSMNFRNCFNLEKDARNIIWRDLWLRNQSIFIQFPSFERAMPIVITGACIPGNEVPEWFEHSIQVNTNRPHPNGFYFFVVLSAPTNCSGYPCYIEVTCKGSTESGETFDSTYKTDLNNDTNMLFHTEHTIVWCHHLGWQQHLHNNQFYLNRVTFLFSATMYFDLYPDSDGNVDDSDGNADDGRRYSYDILVVKSGVMPLYYNDDEDKDYYNKGQQQQQQQQQWGSSSTVLAEEEPGGACGLDLNFPASVEEGRGAYGFDLNFSAPIEDDLNLDLGLASSAEGRANFLYRSGKRERGNDEEEEPCSHKRNN